MHNGRGGGRGFFRQSETACVAEPHTLRLLSDGLLSGGYCDRR
ncbi:hypothetical protein HMPREF9123_0448 [Neisseria bacilliformis ATCC BAA-1200]|uniref:Uncharacterized protein n=1 Tax=Neisseria bacilliformis ATCC BAA-1200 TaxID=888742 RepID=F2B9M5_9NEIS|nr:hypothetical protein HMPREF9123_0448 [Neisseria bacilliformis ATCC BAA-1200]